VVGVLAAKGQSPMGQDLDDAAFVPHTTFRAKLQGGLKNLIAGNIFVGATGRDATSKAEAQIRSLLRERHRLGDGADDDFSIRNLAETASASQEGARTLTTLLAAIAAVSLVVGGIGIMNIMLVSVTERTREIGVRKALGARRARILSQFLVESVTLSVLGGVFGVLLGAGIALGAKAILDVPASIPIWAVVLSLALTGGAGLLFGIYPAARASKLDPVEAMRTE
jgi:putative ABC transport system permease protein